MIMMDTLQIPHLSYKPFNLTGARAHIHPLIHPDALISLLKYIQTDVWEDRSTCRAVRRDRGTGRETSVGIVLRRQTSRKQLKVRFYSV